MLAPLDFMRPDRLRVSGCEAARLRLAGWARVYRRMMISGAPNPHYYNRSAFVDGRIDHAQIRQWLDFSEDTARALQVDEWLQVLRSVSPTAYEAVFIHYVERAPGGIVRPPVEDRMKLWHKRTGKKKSTFYDTLQAAERYIACMLFTHHDEFDLTLAEKNRRIQAVSENCP